jgi:hypothetical protein
VGRLERAEQSDLAILVQRQRLMIDRLKQAYLQERSERMKLQEENIRLREQNEQLLTHMHGLIRGRADISKTVNMIILDITEAQGTIRNAWKTLRQRIIPWDKVALLVGFLAVVGLLAYRPEYVEGIGLWLSDTRNQFFMVVLLVVFGVVGYYLWGRRRAK